MARPAETYRGYRRNVAQGRRRCGNTSPFHRESIWASAALYERAQNAMKRSGAMTDAERAAALRIVDRTRADLEAARG